MATKKFGPSAACCSTPAVIGPPYNANGEFIDVDGTTTYVAGPPEAVNGIFMLYDVFGFSGQILEGADKLAAAGFRVFMPGVFGDSPAPLDWMPVEREGEVDEAKLDAFTEGPGETQKTLRRIDELMQRFKAMHPSINKWCLVGYCWGGYIVPFACGKNSPFAICAALHPGFPEEVAAEVSVPYLALCSKDEPEEMYKDFEKLLKVPKKIVPFPEMVHGWLSARADLSKPKVREEYDRGYEMILEWFRSF